MFFWSIIRLTVLQDISPWKREAGNGESLNQQMNDSAIIEKEL
jgi:hypothetical protein